MFLLRISTIHQLQMCEPLNTTQKCNIVNPATNTPYELHDLQPSDARRTLGAIIDPTGNATSQLSHTVSKAKDFYGKFLNASVSQATKWAEVTTVIEPALLYLLVNIQYSEEQIKPLNSRTSQIKCIALGLNRHFPRAILRGPPSLGGIGTPSSSQKIILEKLNYFYYNVCRDSTNNFKFEISMIYTPLEVGVFIFFHSI